MSMFQGMVVKWMLACFNPTIAADMKERSFRFLEESLELVQVTGCTREEAHALVDYVYSRPVGEIRQEVGGVMVTLAALCAAVDHGEDEEGVIAEQCGWAEIERICRPEIMEKIRQKQASKKIRSGPLP